MLQLLVRNRRSDFAKDVELLVLRHQLFVLGRPALRVSAWSPDASGSATEQPMGLARAPGRIDNHEFAVEASALIWSPMGDASPTSERTARSSSRHRTAKKHVPLPPRIRSAAFAWSRDGTHILATRTVNRWPLDARFSEVVAAAADGSGETAITGGAVLVEGISGPGDVTVAQAEAVARPTPAWTPLRT